MSAAAAAAAADAPAPEAPPLYLLPRDAWFKPPVQRNKEIPKRPTPASAPATAPAPTPARKSLPKPPARPAEPAPPPAARPPTPPAEGAKPSPPEPVRPSPSPSVPAPAPQVPPAAEPPAPAIEPKATAPKALTLGGEYRFALLAARPRGGQAGFGQQLNRVRLKVDANPASVLALHVENDFDLTTGNYLRSAQFQREQAGIDQPRQYWSARRRIAHGRGYDLSSSLYRGFGKLTLERTDVTLGRQRIALGTGLFWSALDMLNPPNPLRIEREEYMGVDALLVEQKIGELSKLSIAYAPDPDRRSDRWVSQYRANVKGADLTLTYGKYWGDRLVGVDVATQLGNAGLHGEWAFTRPELGRSFHKGMLGWDYAFPNTLTFSFEAYYSGQRAQDRDAAQLRHPQMAFVQPPGSAYGGLTIGYDVTPLLRASAAMLFNLRDNSRVLYPAIAYSLSDDSTLLLGGQFFFGSSTSEYGSIGNTYFLRVQYFF